VLQVRPATPAREPPSVDERGKAAPA
jgi:hypothetical protein